MLNDQDNEDLSISLGDQVVVQGIFPPAIVEKIWFDEETKRVVIELNWGDRGHSKVYLHDQDKVWYKYTKVN
jgi:hypothetical protein